MSYISTHKREAKQLLVLVGVLVLCRALFIMLMPETYSKDLYAWLDVIQLLKDGGNPYQDARTLNWPPVWMQVLFVIGKVSSFTSISATHLIQATLVSGEIAVMIAVYRLCSVLFVDKNVHKVLLFALAVNPVSIFLSCQHCNFDVLVGFWVMLFVSSLVNFHKNGTIESWLAACFFLGMGILTKTIPFILAPILIAGIRQIAFKTKLFGLLLLFTPVTIGMSIIYTLAPQGVSEHVLSYRSMAGWYGVSGVFNIIAVYDAIAMYSKISPYIILTLMGFSAFRLYSCNTLSARQIVVITLILLTFLSTFGPGYSPPYILWYMPLFPVFFMMSDTRVRKYMVLGYIVLAITYATEYMFFDSHGAFIKTYFPDAETAALCEYLGQSKTQSILRLPMFASYIIFFTILIRDKSNPLAASNSQNKH